MFGWFKKKPAADPVNQPATGPGNKQYDDFQRHAVKAEGSPFVRSMIASAMCTVEEERVTLERNKLTAAEQLKFMVIYGCFVAYALRIGVERIASVGAFQNARDGIRSHYNKYSYFDADIFEFTWTLIDDFMRLPIDTGKDAPDPIGKLLVLAHTEGVFPISKDSRTEFDTLVGFELLSSASFVEKTARYILQRPPT
jgi:hypothetical protein